MYIFKVNGKEYRVRFSFRTVCKDDLLDRIMNLGDVLGKEETPRGMVDKLATTLCEMLLAGLQKYHKDEFGYKTEDEKQEKINVLLDMLDDYEDENSDGENKRTAFSLFTDLRGELENNSFLSALIQNAEEAQQMKETAETAMKEIEETPARVVATNPSESKH